MYHSGKANASHGAVRGREDVVVQFASDVTRVSAFLWIGGGCCITILRSMYCGGTYIGVRG